MPVLLMVLLLAAWLPAQAATPAEERLIRDLQRIARDSNQGTPRAISPDITDQGFTVDGRTLINHLSVRPAHAEQMRRNPAAVRRQLATSVCTNANFRLLLSHGAVLRYQFSEDSSNWPVASESFMAEDCADRQEGR